LVSVKKPKGKQRLMITEENGESYEELIPKWRHINVFEGGHVEQGEIIEYSKLVDVNIELEEAGKIPCGFQMLLLDITKGSLVTESFISAASFQEITRVLTETSVSWKQG
jgi:hypothetical protein